MRKLVGYDKQGPGFRIKGNRFGRHERPVSTGSRAITYDYFREPEPLTGRVRKVPDGFAAEWDTSESDEAL